MNRIDELPPGRPQNEPRKLVSENKDQQLHFALSIAEHLARTLDEERALRHGIVLDYQKLTEEHAAAVARTDNTATELSNFLTDLEALIPEDCRNTRPDRLASVRAAVGMMAQRLAGDGAIPGVWDWVSNAPYGGSLLPENFVLSSAQPGTGAWAWEQMQRGPDVWVRRQDWPMSDRVHLVEPGLIVDQEGARAGKKLGAVGSPMWPEWLAIDDWELCAAPGSKEAKQAEFYALADSVSDTPLTAPSAKDGPTDGLVRALYMHCIESSFGTLLADDQKRTRNFAHALWHAAREGMVERSELETARFCADETALKLTAAERRVGELELKLSDEVKAALLLAGDAKIARVDADQLRAELERVKAELERTEASAKKTGAMLGAWQEMARTLGIESWPGALPGQSLCETTKRYVESLKTELAGLSGHVQCVADIAAALDKIEVPERHCFQ